MTDFKQLVVWQKSMELAQAVYSLSTLLPKNEAYGLSSQIRRCAVSIPSNISEGYGRKTRGEYLQFLSISSGSACELETQLVLLERIYGLDVGCELSTLVEVQKMLAVLQSKLRASKP